MSDLTDKLAGRFLVIDGPDGAGKSTQLRLLAEFLRAGGLAVCEVRDPGGTPIGERIREVLLDNAHTEMTIGCEILLYMASRTQLMGEVIAPALAAGRCVLCDRWVSSTVAYQVAEGKAEADEVLAAYRLALRDVWPDLTVILDVPAETGLARLEGQADRIEAKGPAFHRRVRSLFLAQAEQRPAGSVVLDGTGAVEEVQAALRRTLEDWTPPHA